MSSSSKRATSATSAPSSGRRQSNTKGASPQAKDFEGGSVKQEDSGSRHREKSHSLKGLSYGVFEQQPAKRVSARHSVSNDGADAQTADGIKDNDNNQVAADGGENQGEASASTPVLNAGDNTTPRNAKKRTKSPDSSSKKRHKGLTPEQELLLQQAAAVTAAEKKHSENTKELEAELARVTDVNKFNEQEIDRLQQQLQKLRLEFKNVNNDFLVLSGQRNGLTLQIEEMIDEKREMEQQLEQARNLNKERVIELQQKIVSLEKKNVDSEAILTNLEQKMTELRMENDKYKRHKHYLKQQEAQQGDVRTRLAKAEMSLTMMQDGNERLKNQALARNELIDKLRKENLLLHAELERYRVIVAKAGIIVQPTNIFEVTPAEINDILGVVATSGGSGGGELQRHSSRALLHHSSTVSGGTLHRATSQSQLTQGASISYFNAKEREMLDSINVTFADPTKKYVCIEANQFKELFSYEREALLELIYEGFMAFEELYNSHRAMLFSTSQQIERTIAKMNSCPVPVASTGGASVSPSRAAGNSPSTSPNRRSLPNTGVLSSSPMGGTGSRNTPSPKGAAAAEANANPATILEVIDSNTHVSDMNAPPYIFSWYKAGGREMARAWLTSVNVFSPALESALLHAGFMDMIALTRVTESDLVKLSITPGVRRKLLAAVDELNQKLSVIQSETEQMLRKSYTVSDEFFLESQEVQSENADEDGGVGDDNNASKKKQIVVVNKKKHGKHLFFRKHDPRAGMDIVFSEMQDWFADLRVAVESQKENVDYIIETSALKGTQPLPAAETPARDEKA